MTNPKPKDVSLSEIMAGLRSDYLISFPKKIERLDLLLDQQNLGALKIEFHNLKGTGKTYGFPEVSILCDELEKHCKLLGPDFRLVKNAIDLMRSWPTLWEQKQSISLESLPLLESIKILNKKGQGS